MSATCTVCFTAPKIASWDHSARWRCAKTYKCAHPFVTQKRALLTRALAGWDLAAVLSGQGARAGRGADDEQVSVQQRRRGACGPVLPQAKMRQLQRRARRQSRVHLVRHAGGGACCPHTWRCGVMCCFACCNAFDGVHGRAALPNNPGNPAMFDWGTYVNGGRPDPTWCVPSICVSVL